MSVLKNIFSTFISFVAFFKMMSAGYTGVEAFVTAAASWSTADLIFSWIIDSRKLHTLL